MLRLDAGTLSLSFGPVIVHSCRVMSGPKMLANDLLRVRPTFAATVYSI
jgi:hypothetical protein